MLENRILLTATLGYILGIIWGLYCKYSIALLFLGIYLISFIFKNKNEKRQFKLLSLKRYFRYVKLLFTKKVIKIIVIFSIISNSIVLFQNQKFNNLYKNLENQEVVIKATVISNQIKNEKFIIKVENINGSLKYKNTRLYLYVNKNESKNITYGSELVIKGTFNKASKRTNYKGFDYSSYLKTLKIYGIIKSKNIQIISQNNLNPFLICMNNVHLKIKSNIEDSLENNVSKVLEGIILGDKDEVDETIITNFSKSNISHILAISGLHISYIIVISSFIFNKSIGKHYSKIFTSTIILLYMFIANFSPSVVRAGITGIMAIMSNFFYRKNDIWQTLSIALIAILIDNPFLIQSISLQLSFTGTIGIIIFQPIIKKWWNGYKQQLNKKAIRNNIRPIKRSINLSNSNVFKALEDVIIVTISATLSVTPIVLINFNKVNISNLIIGLISSFLVGPIVILGFLFSIFSLFQGIAIFQLVNKALIIPLSIILSLLIKVSEIGSLMPFNQAYLITPSISWILIYYIFVFSMSYIVKLSNEKKLNNTQKRVKNVISLFKYKFNQNKKKMVSLILIFFLLFSVYTIIPKNLKIFFIDVGQGDSTLIITPRKKTILIDGGGSENKDFSIGERTLMPYLLDRKISSIDYVMISHFDTDHIGGLLYVMENMKVNNVIISKQPETSENYELFLNIVKKKKIKVIVVNKGDKLNIEKNVYFKILSPDSNSFITKNALNNNSIVCKLCYKSFSMLFTGDIEEEAEKQILEQYKNSLQVLNSTILKVAHHGSKSSSTEEFIKAVKSKIALIGVGKNNKFGHPNEGVIKRLENMRHENL